MPKKPKAPPSKKPGWRPPPGGPARTQYSLDYIAGKLTEISRQLGGKKGK